VAIQKAVFLVNLIFATTKILIMKNLLFAFLLLISVSVFSQQMNVVTFNIRYNTQYDGVNAWPNRVDLVSGLLKFHEADLFGLQEALHGQILDLQKNLPGFEWFGVGRDDGENAGEFSPIFYNKSKLILIESGTLWLSETPEKPSKGWDAALNRIITWGKFKSKVTGKLFYYYNTHFDHKGVEARKKSAELITQKIKEMTGSAGYPVILTGDFNLTPETEGIAIIRKYLRDSREITIAPPYGPVGTFNSFDWNAPMKDRIDYIFVNEMVEVLKYAVLTDSKEMRWPSDHLPVFAKIQLK
jgi:endonuclease/exonuclease/phosphatase family metal-dependent hydrolase